MLEIEITRLIAAAVAAFLLGYACYVAAYVKHKNAILDERNDRALTDKVLTDQMGNPVRSEDDLAFKVRVEKVSSWYFGYRLALLGLIIVSTAVGWALGWAVSQETVLTWIEDAAIAAAGAVVGGLVLDKYIIHPIADGSFFERVEDPIVQRFLQDGTPIVESKVKKLSRKEKKQLAKAAEVAADLPPVIIPAANEEVLLTPEDANVVDVSRLTFDEKMKLLEQLKKSL